MRSLMNSTLISGAHDAVLVDTTVTFGQAGRLGQGHPPVRPWPSATEWVVGTCGVKLIQ
ncbi:hypothetical protein SHIRM173S_07600 [Streptomyces hirsutus]